MDFIKTVAAVCTGMIIVIALVWFVLWLCKKSAEKNNRKCGLPDPTKVTDEVGLAFQERLADAKAYVEARKAAQAAEKAKTTQAG